MSDVGSTLEITAPFAGTVVAITHRPGDQVRAGAAVVVLEAMKMEHELTAEIDGAVAAVDVALGQAVQEGQRLVRLRPGSGNGARQRAPARSADASSRPDLEAVRDRHAL